MDLNRNLFGTPGIIDYNYNNNNNNNNNTTSRPYNDFVTYYRYLSLMSQHTQIIT